MKWYRWNGKPLIYCFVQIIFIEKSPGRIDSFLIGRSDWGPMLKKSLSSLAVRRFVLEAKSIVGAYFQKAYQIDYDTLVLRFAIKRSVLSEADSHGSFKDLLLESQEPAEEIPEGIITGEGGGNYVRFDLYFKMGGYLFISPKVNREMPTSPAPFAMKLRKTLNNRILKDISQVGMDRLVVLTFNPSPGERDEWKLYLELFGDGNAILVKGDTIEAPFTSRAWSSRTVKRGETFAPPPSGVDAFQLTSGDMRGLIEESGEDLVRFLIKRCSLPPVYAEEVCLRSGLDKKTGPKDLTLEQFELLYDSFRELLMEVLDEKDIYIHVMNDRAILVEPALLSGFFGNGEDQRTRVKFSEGATDGRGTYYSEMGSINQALELHMFEENTPGEVRQETKLEKRLQKIQAMIKTQQKAKEDRETEAESTKRIADALYIDYARIDNALRNFDHRLYMEDPEQFPEIVEFIPGSDPRKGRIKIEVETEKGKEIAQLELVMDINQNAELLYSRSKTARKKLEGIEKALKISMEKQGPKKNLRRFWFEAYRWCYSSDRILLIAGRDAKTNERIVKKYMRDTDLYAHADLSGAASVVIRIDKEQEASEITKEQGIHLSILYSKAWNAKVGSAGGYWVLPDQVSRTPQSGEFLAKGSFIIRGKKNFVEKLPLVGAVGTVYVDGVPKIMFGPEGAVENVCQGTYFIVRPGRTKKSDISKILSKELGGELDQVMSVLPPGDMDIQRVERT
jgi:predicted ribosome quality control (RQC) complex YloA/Tae2 family protein